MNELKLKIVTIYSRQTRIKNVLNKIYRVCLKLMNPSLFQIEIYLCNRFFKAH